MILTKNRPNFMGQTIDDKSLEPGCSSVFVFCGTCLLYRVAID